MRILAIETVGTTGSVAAMDGARLLREMPLEAQRRSAQTLAPGIHALLAEVGWKPAEVQLVAVATGPGSFTGLRIGVTTAKTFAYAVGSQVAGVNSLEAIAWRAPLEPGQVVKVILDAQRGELFVAEFSRAADGKLIGRDSTRVMSADQWLADLIVGDLVSGTGLAKVASRLPEGVTIVEQALWSPSAAAVGAIGESMFTAGARESVFDLVPRYFRRTAAEEQWEKKVAR